MFFSKKIISILYLLLLLAVNVYAFEQSLSPQDNITVGDKVVLNIKADGLTVDSLDKSKLQELNFGDFELLDVQSAQDNSVNFILSVYKSGKTELLSVELQYEYENQQKFVKTNAVPVEIKSVLNPQEPSQDVLDIKGIVKFNHSLLWYLYFVLAIPT